MQHGRMELHELHVGNSTLGTVYHSDTVTGGNDRIGGGQIDGSTATRTHHGDLGKISVYLLRLGIQHIGAIALDMR